MLRYITCKKCTRKLDKWYVNYMKCTRKLDDEINNPRIGYERLMFKERALSILSNERVEILTRISIFPRPTMGVHVIWYDIIKLFTKADMIWYEQTLWRFDMSRSYFEPLREVMFTISRNARLIDVPIITSKRPGKRVFIFRKKSVIFTHIKGCTKLHINAK